MTEVTLEAIGLTKRFGTRIAVDQVGFTAHRGEVLGLLGSNGAGKTTTIRLLTTVLNPTAGEFSVDGVPSSRPTEIRRRVGVLAESAGYPGQQTGRDYLRYHARLFGLARADAERVALRLLGEVGLAERATSRISAYSRGMRQRLGIARALVNDPSVVFLDEPTLGLDPAGQRQILDIVRTVAAEGGATVVLSTHTLPEVEEVCTSVLILAAGRVLTHGSVGEVTRAVAAVPRSARLRVPVEFVASAAAALEGVPGLLVGADHDRPDLLTISTNSMIRETAGLNAALQAVLAAGIPVLSFEVEGARLGDAFAKMTTAGVR